MKAGAWSAAGLLAVFSTAYGSIWFMDARYAPMEAFQDIVWGNLKEQIRDIRRDLRENPDNPDNPDLKEELDVFIDRLCKDFPKDRECTKGPDNE